MADERNELVRVPDQEALEMLSVLAAQDLRKSGTEIAWLIRQEYSRRLRQSPQSITETQEEAAGQQS